MSTKKPIIIDTNVFVAAAFNPSSKAAQIIKAVRSGEFDMVWNQSTLRETKKVLEIIPRIKWSDYEDIFKETTRIDIKTDASEFADTIDDPGDRKFAALAKDSDGVIISNDKDFLMVHELGLVQVFSSAEFADRHEL